MTILIWLGLALCVAGFAVNLTLLLMDGVSTASQPIYPILQYSLMFLATVALFVILLSVLINSSYSVDEKYFKTRFGLIVSKYDVKTIDTITLDRKTDKLAVTFENGNYIVIVVKQVWYNDFVEALLAANPKIEYSIISLENTPDDENKKK